MTARPPGSVPRPRALPPRAARLAPLLLAAGLALLGACEDPQEPIVVPQPGPSLEVRSRTGTFSLLGAWVDTCRPSDQNPSDGTLTVSHVRETGVSLNALFWPGDLTCSGKAKLGGGPPDGPGTIQGDQPGVGWFTPPPAGLPATLTATRVFLDLPGYSSKDVLFVDDTLVPPRSYSGFNSPDARDADGYPTSLNGTDYAVHVQVAPVSPFDALAYTGAVPLFGPPWRSTCHPDGFGNGVIEQLIFAPDLPRWIEERYPGDPACLSSIVFPVTHFLVVSHGADLPAATWVDAGGGPNPPAGLPPTLTATGANLLLVGEALAPTWGLYADNRALPVRLYRGTAAAPDKLRGAFHFVQQ